MLCSVCKKNTAVIFVNTPNKDGKIENVGYCYDCAKKNKINPLNSFSGSASFSNEDISNLNSQLNEMFKDISENLNIDELNAENFENSDYDDQEKGPMGFAIPLGSIFSGMFGSNKGNSNASSSHFDKKVKTEAKPNTKKRKALDTFGTNLTVKARNSEIDNVIGRDKEISRIIQILNRRTKNNPCLIGEPGVGKTAIAQGLALRIANGEVPAKLLNKEVYLLDMTAVVVLNLEVNSRQG